MHVIQNFFFQIKDVNTHMLENRMESFFLAETIKYLYLLFDPDNFIHNTGDHGTKIQTPNGECIIDTGSYIFNTEGHPVDTAALYCCSAEKKEDDAELQDFHDNLDLLSMLDVHDNTDTVRGVKWNSRRKRKSDFELEDVFIDGGRLKSQLKGDHQNILSTEGKVFTVKGVNVPVILNIQGSDIKIGGSKEKDGINTGKVVLKEVGEKGESIVFKPRHKVQFKEVKPLSVDSEDSCSVNKDGSDCKEDNSGESEKEKYSRSIKVEKSAELQGDIQDKDVKIEKDRKIEDHVLEETEEKYGSSLTEDMKSAEAADDDDDDVDDENEDDEEELDDEDDDGNDEDEKHKPTVKKPVTVLGQQVNLDLKGASIPETVIKPDLPIVGLNKLGDVMEILKSLTTDLLTEHSSSSSSVKTLHNKLKFYNLFKHSDPELMTCKAQPFYMRFSAMGEMFLDN